MQEKPSFHSFTKKSDEIYGMYPSKSYILNCVGNVCSFISQVGSDDRLQGLCFVQYFEILVSITYFSKKVYKGPKIRQNEMINEDI